MSLTAQTSAAPVARNNAATAAAAAPTVSAAAPTEVAIQVDLAKSLGPYKPIGGGSGTTRPTTRSCSMGGNCCASCTTFRRCPVYIRAHHLFTSGRWPGQAEVVVDAMSSRLMPMASRSTTSPSSTRSSTSTQAAGVRPMVELGFMPKDLASGTMAVRAALSEYGQRIGAEPAQGLRDVGRAGAALDRAPGAAIRQGRGCDVVLRGVERAGHRLLAGHAGGVLKLYDYSVAGIRKALPDAHGGRAGGDWAGISASHHLSEQFFQPLRTRQERVDRRADPAGLCVLPSQGPEARFWLANPATSAWA